MSEDERIYKFRKSGSLYTYNDIKRLIGRSEALERLTTNFGIILKEPESFSINCLITGKGSTGKSLVARYFGRDIRLKAVKKKVKLSMEYFNCFHFRSKSMIIRELIAKNVPLRWDRGYRLNQSLLYSKLKQEKNA